MSMSDTLYITTKGASHKKMQLNYGLLLKRSDPPPPILLELLGHFFDNLLDLVSGGSVIKRDYTVLFISMCVDILWFYI